MNGLPVGLRGFLAQRQMAGQEQNQQLGQMQGLLGIKAAMEQNAMNAEMMPLKMQQIKAQMEAEERKNSIIQGLLGGAGGGQVQRDASGQPVTGGMSSPGQGGIMNVLRNPEAVAQLKLAGIDLTEMYKHLDTRRELKPGSTYESRVDGSREFIPKVGEGMMFGPGGVSMAPGYLPALSAVTGAQEGAKAGFDLVDVPVPGGVQQMTRADAARRLSGGQPQAPQTPQVPQVAPGLVGPDQFPRVSPQEQAQRDAQAGRIIGRENNGGGIPTNTVVPGSGAGAPAGGLGFKPTPRPQDQKFAETLSGKSAEMYSKIVDDSLKVSDNLDLSRKALDQFARYSASAMGGTGPFATAFGAKQYFDKDTQALEATFRQINLKNMVATFAGMSRAIDTEIERAAWESTQPNLTNDDPVNAQILTGAISLSAKAAAEGDARRRFMEENKTLEGYVSPVIGKTTVLFSTDGEPIVVPKSEVQKLKKNGYRTDAEYAQDVLGIKSSGGWSIVR